MEMRTTVWDIVRLAWQLIRRDKERVSLRIGQMLLNSMQVNRSNQFEQDLYYVENERLIARLKESP